MKDEKIQVEGQLSIFDLLNIPSDIDKTYSAQEINDVVNRLLNAQKKAEKREKEEQRIRQEKERVEKARAELEAKEKHVREVTCMDLPLDWYNAFDKDSRTVNVHFDSISDAMIHCLTTLGKVDIEFISSITGADYKTVINTLRGSIFQNPLTWNECFYKGWETADEYLSGNLMRKWKTARAADKQYKGYFADNVRALEKVMPEAVAAEDIYVTLGSPWVPTDIIDDFIVHMLGDPMYCYYGCGSGEEILDSLSVKHDELTGMWEIPRKTWYGRSVAVTKTWGTDRMGALYILEKTLNMKTIAVMDEVTCLTNKSGKMKIINKQETMSAVEKQQKMIREFQKWVWEDKTRKERLEIIFENNYSCIKRRIFDGSYLDFPGMSKSVNLYPYQKNAVARILYTPNTLLAHDVGAGKTYVMIAAGQELRRMGISKKNMYVVPNNIVGQWKNIFLTMYPGAKLLIVEPKSFGPKKRESVLEAMRDNDYDAIIIAYSCFEQIPLSKSFYLAELNEKKEEIERVINQKNKATSGLRKKSEKINDALDDLYRAMKEDCDEEYAGVYFDELGITRLFVDEAHNFKNVPLETQQKNVLGINANGSKKCRDMMDKVHMIQKMNDGKGVVMATGTPITNSITDAFIMQQYLQSGELAMLDLQNFDSWVGMFAEQKTDFEIDVDTSSYRLATRFSKFHNMPELTSLLALIADFHQVDESAGIPKHDGYIDTLVTKTKDFSDYLEEISRRADDVRSGIVSRTDDNMLKITSDGRKAALDLRLIDPQAKFIYTSKVAKCAENAADIYFKTMSGKSTQIIFCDISTPKSGFNIYDELKDHLISLGVPGGEIAFIHDAETETKREDLFLKMRSGEIRILIGSTFKLGLGVNVQDRLIGLHHIDVPWRPADMTQREGRILRQGNLNPKVYIYRYITEGSFDAYSWQLLETKQRFIADLLSGSLSDRDGSDIEDTVLNYAEVKALAVGNPLVKMRVEAQNELSRYQSLQRHVVEARLRMEKDLLELPSKIEMQREDIDRSLKDISAYKEWKASNPPAETAKEREREAEARRQLRDSLNEAIKNNEFTGKETYFSTYRGFDIILPANMDKVKPYIWLQKAGRYYIEMGDTIVGNLLRIDHFLDGMEDRTAKLKNGLIKYEDKKRDIEAELARNENYADKIEELKNKVKKLDRKLGVSDI